MNSPFYEKSGGRIVIIIHLKTFSMSVQSYVTQIKQKEAALQCFITKIDVGDSIFMDNSNGTLLRVLNSGLPVDNAPQASLALL